MLYFFHAGEVEESIEEGSGVARDNTTLCFVGAGYYGRSARINGLHHGQAF